MTKRSRTATRRKSFKRARTARAPLRKKVVRQIVQKEISRMAEDKEAQIYQPGWLLRTTSTANWDVVNVRNMGFGPDAMNITQGVGQGQRVGNKFRIKKMMLRGILYPQGYSESTNPDVVPRQIRMIFFYKRTSPMTTPTPKGDFLQLGNTDNALQNNLMDMTAPINEDIYRVLGQRRFKLGLGNFLGDGFATGSVANGYYNNNDFKYNCQFRVNLAKMLPKVVTFDDNTDTCLTRSIFCAVIISRADGQAGGAGFIPVNMQYTIDLKYEDT